MGGVSLFYTIGLVIIGIVSVDAFAASLVDSSTRIPFSYPPCPEPLELYAISNVQSRQVHYLSCFNISLGIPVWTAHQISFDRMHKIVMVEKDLFSMAAPAEFNQSIYGNGGSFDDYQFGLLVPVEDFRNYQLDAAVSTYLTLNRVPMDKFPYFGKWRCFEYRFRSFLTFPEYTEKTFTVITGVNPGKTRASEKDGRSVNVPSDMWKLIIDPDGSAFAVSISNEEDAVPELLNVDELNSKFASAAKFNLSTLVSNSDLKTRFQKLFWDTDKSGTPQLRCPLTVIDCDNVGDDGYFSYIDVLMMQTSSDASSINISIAKPFTGETTNQFCPGNCQVAALLWKAADSQWEEYSQYLNLGWSPEEIQVNPLYDAKRYDFGSYKYNPYKNKYENEITDKMKEFVQSAEAAFKLDRDTIRPFSYAYNKIFSVGTIRSYCVNPSFFSCIPDATVLSPENVTTPCPQTELTGVFQQNETFDAEIFPLPGIDFVGYGYDLRFDTASLAVRPQILKYSYREGTLFNYPTFFNRTFIVPDEIILHNIAFTEAKASLYTTLADYKRDIGAGLGVNFTQSDVTNTGFSNSTTKKPTCVTAGNSTNTTNSNCTDFRELKRGNILSLGLNIGFLKEEFDETNTYLVENTETTQLYNMYIDNTRVNALPAIQEELVNVTRKSFAEDPGTYFKFLDRYGTHFVVAASMGGQVVMRNLISKKINVDTITLNASINVGFTREVKEQDALSSSTRQFTDALVGSIDFGYSKMKKKTEFQTQSKWLLLGGDGTLVNLLGSNNATASIMKWKRTVTANPVPVIYRLKEMSTLLEDSYQQLQMKAAIQTFLSLSINDLQTLVDFNPLTRPT